MKIFSTIIVILLGVVLLFLAGSSFLGLIQEELKIQMKEKLKKEGGRADGRPTVRPAPSAQVATGRLWVVAPPMDKEPVCYPQYRGWGTRDWFVSPSDEGTRLERVGVVRKGELLFFENGVPCYRSKDGEELHFQVEFYPP